MDNVKQEILAVYKTIICKHLRECHQHALEHDLTASDYNDHHDAVGLTYYEILERHSDNKELVEYARKRFME